MAECIQNQNAGGFAANFAASIAADGDIKKQPRPFKRPELLFCLERATGIEPASSAWKSEINPEPKELERKNRPL